MHVQNYNRYFTTKTRPGTDQDIIILIDEAPEEIKQLVQDIHMHFDVLPNDWIYEQIDHAFDDLSHNKLDECSFEPDCYYSELYKWFGFPFAHHLCNEALQEGYCDSPQNIYDIISMAQYLAKKQIYDFVNDFIKEKIHD